MTEIVAAVGCTVLLAVPAAAEVSPVQSTDRPFGLDIWAPVELAGSDAQAQEFLNDVLPGLQSVVDANLSETLGVTDLDSIMLNPNQLVLSQESNARIYFVGEGAGYHNTLGAFSRPAADLSSALDSGEAKLVFPDASSPTSYLGGNSLERTESTPLVAGDFVDLGTFSAGEQLNFFLISNGANGGTNLYTTDADYNPDGTDHFVSLAVEAVVDSPYLLIGAEDLWGGGDSDYNDLVFAVDIGVENVRKLVASAAPLPPAGWALAAAAIVGWRRRREG